MLCLGEQGFFNILAFLICCSHLVILLQPPKMTINTALNLDLCFLTSAPKVLVHNLLATSRASSCQKFPRKVTKSPNEDF